jgi:hypothetical protein
MRPIRIACGTGALMIFSAAAPAQEIKIRTQAETFNVQVPPPAHGAGGDNVFFQAGAPVAGPGHTFEFISSEMGVAGKVVKNAPYSAEAVTETTQTLADGNRISRKNSTTLYRDAEGRTRREVTLAAIGPWASPITEDPVKMVFIHDPVTGVSYSLNEKDKTARKMEGKAMVVSYSADARERMPPKGEVAIAVERHISEDKIVTEDKIVAGRAAAVATKGMAAIRVPMPDAKNAKTESLGKRNIEGVEAEGTRTTWTIPAGEIGNDRPIEIVSERWFSPQLETMVMTKQSDPRAGETVYKLSNLRRGDPARQLFEVPSDYTVVTEELPRMLRKLRSDK